MASDKERRDWSEFDTEWTSGGSNSLVRTSETMEIMKTLNEFLPLQLEKRWECGHWFICKANMYQ